MSMLSFIGNQFRKPSGWGGRIISLLMKRGNLFAYDKIIPMMDIKPGDHILEIGYGHGVGLDMLCKKYDCQVTGVDFSQLMYKEAKARNKKHLENNKLTLNFGNYLQFNSPKAIYDKIFMINVIYFWRELHTPLEKLFSELKPGGTLHFYMAHADDLNKLKFTLDSIFTKYDIKQVTKALQKVGFIEIENEFDNGYFVSCKKP